MKAGLYRGFRTDKGCIVLDRKGNRLKPRNDLVNHSPDGFEWGYEGSGPAQLALAILADCLGDIKAEEVHQAFKRRVIARLEGGTWALSDAQIHAAIKQIEEEGEIERKHPEVYDDLPF